jgi:hypothetical protein
MKFTKFFLFLIAVSAWSIIPAWAQLAETVPKAKVATAIQAVTPDPGSQKAPGPAQEAIGLLAQMGPGMMGGGGQCGPGGGMGPGYQQGAQNLNSGPDLFGAYCVGCHAGGGNSVMSNLPLRGSVLLKDFYTFRNFIRRPVLPNGGPGPMPGYSPGQISDQQMQALYQYLKSRWGS